MTWFMNGGRAVEYENMDGTRGWLECGLGQVFASMQSQAFWGIATREYRWSAVRDQFEQIHPRAK